MNTIGLTGGIGSGKSIVAKIFMHLGVPVFNADEQAKSAYLNPNIIQQVKLMFGQESFLNSGEANKKFIAEKVFHNKELLQQLNGIIHPFVAAKFSDWEKEHEDFNYGLKEAAIFFESGLNERIKDAIVVTAPASLRISRVQQRDGVSDKDVLARMQNQWSEEKLISLASFVIVNDDYHLIIPQVLKIHDRLIVKSK